MTGRLDEIEAEALAALDMREGLGLQPSYLKSSDSRQLEADLKLAFEELRAYRALRGELMSLVLHSVAYGDDDHTRVDSQIGRYYVQWISKRENL